MKTLKLAVQKSGRLKSDSLSILSDCGIEISNGRDKLKVYAKNFPIEIYFLRNSDIPQYVEDKVVDACFIGENTLIEKQKDLKVYLPLGFSKCRLSLAIPKSMSYTGIDWFNGKRIATSYPNSLQSFLKANKLNADYHKISGSVEIAPNIGLADAVCDIVSSGNTLFNNGLKEVECVLQSEAVLAGREDLESEQMSILNQLIFRLESVLRAKDSKYVLMNVPNGSIDEISSILPVLKSPTILPLALPGWSSLHSVIKENDFWQCIDKLKKAGAEDILVAPIEKIIN